MAEAPRSGGLPTVRLETLADGIFAIAMTLLVFEVKVPSLTGSTSAQVVSQLAQLWPKFASIGLSFLTLGFSWIGHHNQYHFIRRSDRPFLWINLLFLSLMSLVPFFTALLGEYPLQPVVVALYAGNLFCGGLVLYGHWVYATTDFRLVDPDISPEVVAGFRRRVIVAPAGYALAIGLAFVYVRASWVILLAVALYFVIPGALDTSWRRTREKA
jgi:uncharacterized membrane protein